MTLELLETDMPPGTHVHFAGGIFGVVEEVIFCRNMSSPLMLVEYWHEGTLMCARVHAEECRKLEVTA